LHSGPYARISREGEILRVPPAGKPDPKSMIEGDKSLQALLWAGIEDYAGLWEAVWELNSLRPQVPESENRLSAERLVRELLKEGHVRLFESREPYEALTPLPANEIDLVLGKPQSWAEPAPNGVSIRFGTTPSGEGVNNRMVARSTSETS